MKKGSTRKQRVAGLVHSILAEGFQSCKMLKDYTEANPITVTRVEITDDLRIVYCYFVLFNTKMTLKQVEELLHEHRFNIRGYVTSEIKLKYSPQIKFFYDNGFDNLSKVEELLDKLSSK